MSFFHLNGVMFDIETLGRNPGDIVLSIGACRFNIDAREIKDEFYVTIDVQDSLRYGMTYEKATLNWWRDQNPAALKGIQKSALSLEDAMNKFYDYLKKKKNEPIWAWGPHFDVPQVQVAMQKSLKLTVDEIPWKYYNVYDGRTVCNVFGEDLKREEGVHHNALDDAKAQAKYLIEFFKNLEQDQYEDDDIPF